MNRRLFLGSTAALAAAQTRIPIALAGGSHSHASAKALLLRDSPEWDLLGVWEDDLAIRQKYEAARIKLLSRAEVFHGAARVVAVEGPVQDHYASALLALEAGKHVHVEKPPADTMAGMRRLVQTAQQKKLLLQSGYMWRYHPGFDKVIEAKRSGWLGSTRYVGDWADLAAAVRGERPLAVSLADELVIHQTLLAASEMP